MTKSYIRNATDIITYLDVEKFLGTFVSICDRDYNSTELLNDFNKRFGRRKDIIFTVSIAEKIIDFCIKYSKLDSYVDIELFIQRLNICLSRSIYMDVEIINLKGE